MKMSYAIYRVAELVFVLSTCFVMTLSPSAYAATFTVDSTADTVDANPGDRICADEIGNCTLRAAIIETNAFEGLDVINLPSGTYTLSIEGAYHENASASGDLDITDDLTINGTDETETIIDANAIDRVLHILPDIVVEISDVTVTGGNDDYYANDAASGISNSGTLYMNNCTIINNEGITRAGGITNLGTANLTDCIISDNSVTYGAGGINNLHGAILTMTNCTVSNNDGAADVGGIVNNGIAFLANCTISGNNVNALSDVGGIANSGILTMTSCTVSDNQYGGIVNRGTGVATLVGSTIANNYERISGGGGGIWNLDLADLRIENCTILTGQGTGLSVEDGTVEVVNTTFNGMSKETNGQGGHPGIGVNEGIVRVTNSTISNHGEASSGAGIGLDGGGTVTLQNTIVSGNTACCGDADIEGPVTDLGNNEGVELGSFIYSDTPGGGYFPLLATSTAIDAGNDFACTPFDQIGNPRVDGDDNGSVVCDIGAVEYQNEPLINLSGTIKTDDGASICAMVLASGQFMFSCDPIGVFSLTDLPREGNGAVKRQIYADGFFPEIDTLGGSSSSEAVVMTRLGDCPSYNRPYNPGVFPGSAGKRINITGYILTPDAQEPICALVLANGQFMFTCDGSGSYALNIPLDTNGQFKLQVYADGFATITQKFDEFQTTNDVRMARTTECQ